MSAEALSPRYVYVEWDTTTDEYPDGDPEGADLPEFVKVPGTLDSFDIADWLSDEYGWCVLNVEMAVDGEAARWQADQIEKEEER